MVDRGARDIAKRVIGVIESLPFSLYCDGVASRLNIRVEDAHDILNKLVNENKLVHSGSGDYAVYDIPRPRKERLFSQGCPPGGVSHIYLYR